MKTKQHKKMSLEVIIRFTISLLVMLSGLYAFLKIYVI